MTTAHLKVLIVEDSQSEADLIHRMLHAARGVDFEAVHVRRLAEGVARAREGDCDVVLLDLGLPDGQGLDNFGRIREAAPGVPVIILTNLQDEERASRAVREGAQDYLIKREVDSNLLGRAIRYAIERQHAEEALRESEERYALAVAGAMDGLWDWDLTREGVYYSPRWKAILGFGEDELEPAIESWIERVLQEDRPALQAALDEHLQGKTEHFEHEHRILTREGEPLWVLTRGLAVRDTEGRAYRMAGSLTDISARKRAEAKLMHDALHDSLTGLANRNLFLDRLDLALKQYRRDARKRFAVLFFDLDRFKNVNDSLGHSVGDELLIFVARRLEKFLRPGDSVARLGGDEFAILLTDIDDASDATHVAGRVHELLAKEFVISDHEVYTSASVGIALSDPDYVRPEELLRDADLAMYRAKRSGNVSYAIFDSDMHDSAVARLKLETDLRRAVDRGEFVVYYQPIVSLETMAVLGFEALLRWCHPERGVIGPDDFIPTAEETGLIGPITWWVLQQACQQARQWQQRFQRDPPLSISVNIPGRLFAQPNMAARTLEIVEQTGLPPESLHLEITENAIMDHGEAALAELSYLRALGVQLHIDDFGTGYSSLSYLQLFSYDTIKIDRSFVSSVIDSGESNTIVNAIVGLGRMLSMNVVAEGVETSDQAAKLRDMQCPVAQGFWFSAPVSGSAVHGLLSDRQALAG